MALNRQVESLHYISPAYLKRLHKLGIKTLKDLFSHFPHRYDDFTNLKKISEVKIGEEVAIQGEIKKINTRRTFKRKMFITEALINDNSGTIRAVWFNQPYLSQTFKEGDKASLAGKINLSEGGVFLSNPAHEKIKSTSNIQYPTSNLIHTQGLVPIYPETERLSSRWLRFIIYPLLKKYISKIEEFLPEQILQKKKFPYIDKALFQIHFPKTKKEAEIAKKRFAFEKLFLIQLFVQEQKKKLQKQKAPKILPKREYIEEFKKILPFSLTNDQKKAIREILDDLQKEIPTSRLLEGEVGSGKTIVATLSAFVAVKNGYQVAIMAPTEILAEQHFQEISKSLSSLGTKIGLLTSEKIEFQDKKPKKEKIKEKEFIKRISQGKIDVLIGTHSLIQERVKFGKLGLVVVDEQHRFGVEQRACLCRQTTDNKQQTTIPHFLSMTATPIPRTLALTIYGDLSISQIKELPRGRKKIITKIVPPARRSEIYEFFKKEVKERKQAFVICPLIEESEKLQVAAAKKEFERLKKKVFPNFKLGLLHGKMKAKEKDKIMREFKEGKIEILVSTPVVEVGIDVPNATAMIIESADRFGLSQLYQFRGRVGRGELQSFCFLFTDSVAKKTGRRLKAIMSAKDAFELSEKDLKIRGPGDFIGKRQSGIPDLTMASLTDLSLIEEVKKEVEEILEEDPELKKYPPLQKKLEEFKEKVFLE